MKKSFRNLGLALMTVLALGATTSCDRFGSLDNPVGAYVEVDTTTMYLVPGQDSVRVATTISTNALRYQSSNEQVATVDQNGMVHAVALGEAIITVDVAAAENYQAGAQQYKVVVEHPAKLADAKKEGAVIGLAFNLNGEDIDIAFKKENGKYVLQQEEQQEMLQGAPRRAVAVTLSYTLTYNQQEDVLTFRVIENPGNNTVLTVIFNFQDNTIQIIPGNPQTKVLNFTVRIGNIEITAQLKHKDVAPTEVSFTIPSKALYIDDVSELGQNLTVGPDDATDKSVTWTSSNPEVATVDENGKVTAVAAGATVITATANLGGVKAELVVGVLRKNGSISFETKEITKTPDDINSTFTNPLTKTGDGTVTYSSDKPEVATVNATTGAVTVKGEGTAVITATVESGETYKYNNNTATYTLTVQAAQPADVLVTDIKVYQGEEVVTGLKVGANENFTLTAVVLPENATNKNVKWYNTENDEVIGTGSSLTYSFATENKYRIACVATDGSNVVNYIAVIIRSHR